MSIDQSRYVVITSGLGAGATVKQVELIARFITDSDLIPTNAVFEGESASAVADYFGSGSAEHVRAQYYFSFVSRLISRPKKISFSRYVNSDVAPSITSAPLTSTLADLQAITAGSFTLTIGSTSQLVAGVNLSSAASLADVASLVQTAVRGSVIDDQFDTATVIYSGTISGFIITGGVAEVATISIAEGAEALGATMGLVNASARVSPGQLEETLTESLDKSLSISNNFGSMALAFGISSGIYSQTIIEAATWNNTNNVVCMMSLQVQPSNAAPISNNVISLSGNVLTLNNSDLIATEFPEILPMAQLAATNYGKPGASQNYMYLQSTLTPTVTNDADANTYDALRVNYYGRTQSAGQQISFYQRGFMTGQGTDIINMNTYGNELWLKSYSNTQFMTLLLNSSISANASGAGKASNVLEAIISEALENGTISVGKKLSTTAIIFINEITGDDNAFNQVQNSGYWTKIEIVVDSSSGTDEYNLEYTILYSKDDVVRKISGTHALV